MKKTFTKEQKLQILQEATEKGVSITLAWLIHESLLWAFQVSDSKVIEW